MNTAQGIHDALNCSVNEWGLISGIIIFNNKYETVLHVNREKLEVTKLKLKLKLD